jgi:hypothetical protein
MTSNHLWPIPMAGAKAAALTPSGIELAPLRVPLAHALVGKAGEPQHSASNRDIDKRQRKVIV